MVLFPAVLCVAGTLVGGAVGIASGAIAVKAQLGSGIGAAIGFVGGFAIARERLEQAGHGDLFERRTSFPKVPFF